MELYLLGFPKIRTTGRIHQASGLTQATRAAFETEAFRAFNIVETIDE